MRIIIALIALGVLTFSCQPQKGTPVAQKGDYQHLMVASENLGTSLDLDIEFWRNRVQRTPNDFMSLSQLGGLLAQRFRINGMITDLHESDSLFLEVSKITPFSKANTYRNLSANAITKHEFELARTYAELALKEGDDKAASYYMLFDALMELGEYEQAKSILTSIENKNSFDHLVRSSKMADHEGDLDQAIRLMELAYERTRNNNSTFSWSISNLGDMYGHAGRIEDSYNAYLKVLKKDPGHWHSWKGLAWINFAHDGNVKAAKEILEHVQKNSPDPQVTLMLAEIAEFENDFTQSEVLKRSFYAKASSPQYLGMHNKYLILLESEDLNKSEQAIQRANAEQEKRPTPEMYDLLAWAYLQHGESEKALKLASLFVEGQTYEPEVLYHLGVIFKMNDQKKKGDQYLREALEGEFELGPVIAQRIKTALKS